MASLNTDERGMKLAQYESCWKPVCCCVSALETGRRTKLSANAPDGAWTIGSARVRLRRPTRRRTGLRQVVLVECELVAVAARVGLVDGLDADDRLAVLRLAKLGRESRDDGERAVEVVVRVEPVDRPLATAVVDCMVSVARRWHDAHPFWLFGTPCTSTVTNRPFC